MKQDKSKYDERIKKSIEIVKRWALPISEEHRHQLSKYIYDLKFIPDCNSKSHQILVEFVKKFMILYHPVEPPKKSLITSFLFFFGSVATCLSRGYDIENIDLLYSLTFLYSLLDHYIDDNDISFERKKHLIYKLSDLIISPRFVDYSDQLNDPCLTQEHKHDLKLISQLSYHLFNIFQKVPSSLQYLKNLYYAEVLSMKLQHNCKFDRDLYLKLCQWKGGATCQAIQSILNLPVTNNDYELGACIQFVDDIIDVHDDLISNISTAATCDFEYYGNLDLLLFDTLDYINNMSSLNTIFKPILIGSLLYTIMHDYQSSLEGECPIFSSLVHMTFKNYSLLNPSFNYYSSLYQGLLNLVNH